MKKIITVIISAMLLFTACSKSPDSNIKDYYDYIGLSYDELVEIEGEPDDNFMYTYYSKEAFGIDNAEIQYGDYSPSDENSEKITSIFISWYNVDTEKTFKKLKKTLTSIYGEPSHQTENSARWKDGKIGLSIGYKYLEENEDEKRVLIGMHS